MKNVHFFGLLMCALTICSSAQDRVFDWVPANNETLQLDPADYHTGRVYQPGPDGGNIHVDIHAKQPVTITLTWADDWNNAQQHPEAVPNLTYRCVREHVVSTTYECHLPPERAMVLLIHDEREADRAVFTGIGAVLGRGGVKQFLSPNDVTIQYYAWNCVDYCIQPEYQWFRLVKEKYEITSVPKIYSLFTPERDGQQVSVKFKAPVPMTIAVLPSEFADQVYDNPQTLGTALGKTLCKQRGIQSMTFDCTVNLADGPQSMIIMPAGNIPNHKKAEIELQAVKCIANCPSASRSAPGDSR
jgi:hypothetical protein